MRLLILDEGYPHPDNLMGDVFVHVRAKEYAKRHEVKAFAYFYEPGEIVYEGISVRFFDDVDKIVNAVKNTILTKYLSIFINPGCWKKYSGNSMFRLLSGYMAMRRWVGTEDYSIFPGIHRCY